jgi:hypothetical protein
VTVPFDFDRAWEAHEEAQREQEHAEEQVGVQGRAASRAEEAYRVALAAEMWRLRRDEGVAWSALGDLARGTPDVAALKRRRDDAEADKLIANHAVYRRSKDRDDVAEFIAWSKSRDLAEGYGRGPEPHLAGPIGGRRAA